MRKTNRKQIFKEQKSRWNSQSKHVSEWFLCSSPSIHYHIDLYNKCWNMRLWDDVFYILFCFENKHQKANKCQQSLVSCHFIILCKVCHLDCCCVVVAFLRPIFFVLSVFFSRSPLYPSRFLTFFICHHSTSST